VLFLRKEEKAVLSSIAKDAFAKFDQS